MRAKVAKSLRRLVTWLYDADPKNRNHIPYLRSGQIINVPATGRAIYRKLKKTYKSGVKF